MRSNAIAAFLIFLVGVALTAAPSEVAYCQSAALSTESLVQGADVIVVGKVTAMNSKWSNDRSRIYTRVTISVDQQIKGATSENFVTITIPGGEVDGIGEVYSHTAKFTENEEVVVFAGKDRQGNLSVIGGDEGKTTVRKEKETGRQLVSGNESFQMFTAKLERVVKAQGKK